MSNEDGFTDEWFRENCNFVKQYPVQVGTRTIIIDAETASEAEQEVGRMLERMGIREVSPFRALNPQWRIQ